MTAPDFPNELEDAAAKALAMDESSLVFTDGYGGFDFDHGGAARTVLSVVGPLIQQARDADGQRLYSLLALFDTRDGSPLADLVQHAREGWERSHPDMGEDDAWQAFDSLWSRFTDRERSDLGDDRAREKAEQVIRGSMACGVAAERARCPLCDHEWRRHDPEDGMCDCHDETAIGPCRCGRDLAWVQERIAAMSSAALAPERTGEGA